MTPPIISRVEWGAKNPTGTAAPWRRNEPTGWTIHWEGADGGGSAHSLCATTVRAIQNYHLANGYSDIAYSFVVCRHGYIFEGRGNGVQSAAQRGGNDRLLAVCYLGGPATPFTEPAKAAIRHLVYAQGPVYARGKPRGHRNVAGSSTACPGDTISAWIDAGCPAGASAVRPEPANVTHPTLRQGAQGPAVLELQRKLNVVMRVNLRLDGVFGSNTERTVKMFQSWFSQHGNRRLESDGIAGPLTWRALDQAAARHGVR